VEKVEAKKLVFPSVHDAKPTEEGGPTARAGFNYQDEIAVSLLLEMLEREDIECIYCETHDDAVVVYSDSKVECVQVKSNTSSPLWTLAALTHRAGGKAGASIFEKSLSRDSFSESASFRVITLRDVAEDLQFLTFPIGKPGREQGHKNVVDLSASLEKRCPKAVSPKGNGPTYWVNNCLWDVRESQASIADKNLIAIHQLSKKLGSPTFLEPLSALLDELRKKVKDAGAAKWEPDRELKVFYRTPTMEWLKQSLSQIDSSTQGASGGKLQEKMSAAGLPQDLIRLAADMRRRYSEEVRSPRYMEADNVELLQRQVRSAVLSLQSKREADDFGDIADAKFHAICVSSASQVGQRIDGKEEFLLGCMYDISDRCLLRFTKDKR
jgi:hypothetical protein